MKKVIFDNVEILKINNFDSELILYILWHLFN